MNSVSFPTQGEVIQFVFDALGVLPRKNDENASFDETRKKSTQKALQRLAAEDGVLDQRLAEMWQTLSYLVADNLQPREHLALGGIIFDLFEIYQDTLRDEGTFLTKSETIKWLLLGSGVLRLPISVAKHLQRYNVAADGLVTPADIFWYLPSKDANRWIWPLEKAMRWVYELSETSIQKFHWSGATDETSQEKNLESAKKWLVGLHVPFWPSLLKNFNQCFDELDRLRIRQDQPPLSGAHKNSIRTALFVARASTYISKAILSHFGDEVLQEFCSRYQTTATSLEADKQKVQSAVHRLIVDHNISNGDFDSVWSDVTNDYWCQLADRQHLLWEGLRDKRLTVLEVAEIAQHMGGITALLNRQPEIFTSMHSIPEGFTEAVLDGFALLKSENLSIDNIEVYAKQLDARKLSHVLPWMVPWQIAVCHYRAEKYKDAYPFIKQAFEFAQYCAGAHQYKLVNQYIELAAKNDKWRDFNRGIKWANYLQIEVRWLRQDEPTEEKLRFVYAVMKKAVYAI